MAPLHTRRPNRPSPSSSLSSESSSTSSSSSNNTNTPCLKLDIKAINETCPPAQDPEDSIKPVVVQTSMNSSSSSSSTLRNPSSTSTSSNSDTLNCRTVPTTLASGSETYGELNQHPTPTQGDLSFRVGVSVDRNKKCRRTMEDAHSFIYDFGGIKGQGFFAIFDGHAGKHAAEWCGMEFHKHLLSNLNKEQSKTSSVPFILNQTFQQVDQELSNLATTKNLHSGCTAVVAFLRLEDDEGNAVGGNGGGLGESIRIEKTPTTTSEKQEETKSTAEEVKVTGPAEVVKGAKKRTLYVGNVGDARAVLSRGGKAVRLSYDHKGTDSSEVKRITDAGGFVLNNRVNGVLAVTRALGDSSMKEFVVGKPYTTETTIGDRDEWLIVACDGLWDVCTDEEAVEIVEKSKNAQDASQRLLDHALANFSTDNLSVLVVDLKAATRSGDNEDIDGDEVRTEEEE